MGSGTSRSPPHTHTLKTTHPMAVAGGQTELQLLEGSVLAAPVLAHLWQWCALSSVGSDALASRDSSGREGWGGQGSPL